MSDVVIDARGLGKRYRIGAVEAQKTFREALAGVVASPFRKFGRRDNAEGAESFWALRDIAFQVRRGEILGVVGRNGAGKSTLLKILARITEPTAGSVELVGRVGSLLEVGTGFHPELSGRENIYMNGAILGMSRTEVRAKFDEIVAFAEVERFLDTPVKRYSSGMFTRLAFAVAAHLEPDILIVDEVLAVGDAQFQKKCLGKMGDVASQGGRTVLFVSHQMGAITQLCSRAILLEGGKLVLDGSTREVVSRYLSSASALEASRYQASGSGAGRQKEAWIVGAQAVGADGLPSSHFGHNEPIRLVVTCSVRVPQPDVEVGFAVSDQRGRKVFTTNSRLPEADCPEVFEMTATIPGNFLVAGQYTFTFAIHRRHLGNLDLAVNAINLAVFDAGSDLASYEGFDYGCVFADCRWSLGAPPVTTSAVPLAAAEGPGAGAMERYRGKPGKAFDALVGLSPPRAGGGDYE